jgi:hypothetical protein
VLSLLLAGVLAAGGYDGGRTLCTLLDPRITESSGLAASSTDPDLLFTHNDSGDTARFFAIDRGCRTRATFLMSGVQARDWEDISRGPDHSLWLGDIGDNSGRRTQGILVNRVEEPTIGARTVRLRAVSYRLRYPDGPHDAEALLVHPRTGQLLIVTKSFSGGVVYAAPTPLVAGTPNVLRRVGTVPVPEITAGDIAPDGSRVVLRNYTAAYEWDVHGDDVAAALHGVPARIPLPRSQQGEGITYRLDGQALLVSSEGEGSPLQELRRTTRTSPSAATTSAAARPSPTARPASGSSGLVRVLLVLGALVVLAAGVLGLRRTRTRIAR